MEGAKWSGAGPSIALDGNGDRGGVDRGRQEPSEQLGASTPAPVAASGIALQIRRFTLIGTAGADRKLTRHALLCRWRVGSSHCQCSDADINENQPE